MPAPSTLRDRLEESYRLLSVTRPSAEWLLRQAFFRTAGRVQKTLYKRVARSMTHQVAKRQPSANGQPDLPPASDERWCKVSALAFAEAIRVSRLTVIPAGDTSAKTGWHSLYQDVGATVAVTSDWSELATTVQQQPRDVRGREAVLVEEELEVRDEDDAPERARARGMCACVEWGSPTVRRGAAETASALRSSLWQPRVRSRCGEAIERRPEPNQPAIE